MQLRRQGLHASTHARGVDLKDDEGDDAKQSSLPSDWRTPNRCSETSIHSHVMDRD